MKPEWLELIKKSRKFYDQTVSNDTLAEKSERLTNVFIYYYKITKMHNSS